MKIQDYTIYKVGRRIVAHSSSCYNENCAYHEATATKGQLRRMLAGKPVRLGCSFTPRSVTYPTRETVKVGCTTFRRSLVKKAIQLL